MNHKSRHQVLPGENSPEYEKYGLNWPGKAAAIKMARRETEFKLERALKNR